MALVNGTNYDHIDLQAASGGDVTRHKLQDTEGRAMMAPTEDSSTASAAHIPGTPSEYFILGGILRRATADIAQGGGIVTSGSGKNCEAVTVGGELQRLKDEATFEEYQDITSLIDGYIMTNVSVGATVSTEVVSSSNYRHQIISVLSGDIFRVWLKGGDNPRAYAFTNTDYELLSKSGGSSNSYSDAVLIAPADGYLIVNALKNSTSVPNPAILKKSGEKTMQAEFEIVNKDIADVENAIMIDKWTDTEETWQKGKNIYTNVNTGETVDATYNTSAGWRCVIIPVEKEEVYKITASGGGNPRAWAFTDTNYKLISKSGSSVTVTDLEIAVPADGYLIVNSHGAYSAKKQSQITTKAKFAEVDEKLDAVNKDIADVENATRPLVKFDADYVLKDISALRSLISYSDVDTIMPQIYDLFDGLVTDYPDYVTKYDAALYDGLSLEYPRYANGVESGDADYLETDAYKTYMYKLSSPNIAAGNNRNCKKRKVLLVSGTHGSENAAPFNTFIFAKMLCDAVDSNYFKMRDAFDFYIVPCLNGYGMLHTSVMSRVNANGVNINRNFPIANWTEAGSGTLNYTGPYAASEFETQLIVALTEKIEPDLAIDHHNYDTENRQFYAHIGSAKHLNLVYESLACCSYTFIKNLPTYFGTEYQLFVPADADSDSSPNRASGPTVGTMTRWWYENAVPICCTIEICDNIRYLGGTTGHGAQNKRGNDTFSVAEYTLRNQILVYGQWVLESVLS